MAFSPSDLHVITVHSNPARYRSRVNLNLDNQAYLAAAGVKHYLVEATFGERDPEVADPSNPCHLVVRCDHEVWLKEAMINAGEKIVPADAKYIMWMDADISFVRPDWATETIEALQHYDVVQPFSHAIDLGPDGEVIERHNGFAYEYEKGGRPGRKYAQFMHPGYGWAWRRSAWTAVGGMMDRAICGAADHHMAAALIGMGEATVHGGVTDSYKKMVKDWEQVAQRICQRNVGHVPGSIIHYFHGWKADRRYEDRWSILTRNAFDPDVDVVRDSQGMLRLAGNKTGLRDDLRRYFRERMEDATRRSWPHA